MPKRTRRYRDADIVVDQLLAGWYGGFAVEAMALGKPVIAYLRESDLHHVPAGDARGVAADPSHPTSIYDVLKDWLTVRRHALRSGDALGAPMSSAGTMRAPSPSASSPTMGISPRARVQGRTYMTTGARPEF